MDDKIISITNIPKQIRINIQNTLSALDETAAYHKSSANNAQMVIKVVKPIKYQDSTIRFRNFLNY